MYCIFSPLWYVTFSGSEYSPSLLLLVSSHISEGGDRLVEQHEPRGQAQVHAVDEIEGLADDLERVDVGEADSVVAVVDLAQLLGELLLAFARVPDAELGQPPGQRV